MDRTTLETLARIVAAQCPRLAAAPRRGGLSLKPDGSPVTDADIACEAALRDALGRAFPAALVVGEESAPPDGRMPSAGMVALVDPLDGTRAFVEGRDDFCVNLAIVVDGVATIGVVGAPARGVVYAGRFDDGLADAWRATFAPDGTLGPERAPLRARRPAPRPPVGLVSHRHGDAASEDLLTRAGVGERVALSSALKFALLAEGRADLYPRFAPTAAWDTAAGQALLTAAGGETFAPDGTPLRYFAGAPLLNPGFLAAGDGGLGLSLLRRRAPA